MQPRFHSLFNAIAQFICQFEKSVIRFQANARLRHFARRRLSIGDMDTHFFLHDNGAIHSCDAPPAD